MKTSQQGYRIAVVGASSLLGKELLNVLEEHHFPFSRLVTFSDEENELELPILDLREGSKTSVLDENVTASELDFAFIAARSRQMPSSWIPPKLRTKGGALVSSLTSASQRPAKRRRNRRSPSPGKW